MKKLMISCLLASSLMVSPLSVLASDTLDDSYLIDKDYTSYGDTSLVPKDMLSGVSDVSEGSITVKLADTKGNLPKDGVVFSVSKVADFVDGLYVSLVSSDVDLNSINTSNELELAACSLSKIVKGGIELTTGKDGVCSIENLEVGVYLVQAINTNKYDDITPFLVAIPTWNSKSEDMIYNIEILPKHSPKPDKDTGKNSPPDAFDSRAFEFGLLSLVCLVGAGSVYIVSKRFNKSKI